MIHGETATSVFKGHRLIEVCFISACSRISRGMGGGVEMFQKKSKELIYSIHDHNHQVKNYLGPYVDHFV